MSPTSFKVGRFDPVTREPLKPEQLARNVNLRIAAHAWLDDHAWAYRDIGGEVDVLSEK